MPVAVDAGDNTNVGKKGVVRSSSAYGIICFWLYRHLLFSSIDVHAYAMIVYLCVGFIYCFYKLVFSYLIVCLYPFTDN